MRQTVDLNAELREWLGRRLSEVLGDNPENIRYYCLFLDEVNKDLVQIVYNRLCQTRGQVKATAEFLGIDPKTVYNYTKKKPKR